MPISDRAFRGFADLMRAHSGVHLGDAKRQLVAGRLAKRLRTLDLPDYETYLEHCRNNSEELRTLLDTLTTNETSFFREPHHFDFLRREVLPRFKGGLFRAWSAAASIGAEAFSMAMVLDEYLAQRGAEWEILGTDINTEVIARAQAAVYPMEFAHKIEEKYLKKYCLRGTGTQEGRFLIDDRLRGGVRFMNANLMNPPPQSFGRFDAIFLRNMLIYFDNTNKKIIVENVLKALKPGGYLFIGHSESLNHLSVNMRQAAPTVYFKEGV